MADKIDFDGILRDLERDKFRSDVPGNLDMTSAMRQAARDLFGSTVTTTTAQGKPATIEDVTKSIGDLKTKVAVEVKIYPTAVIPETYKYVGVMMDGNQIKKGFYKDGCWLILSEKNFDIYSGPILGWIDMNEGYHETK